MAPGREFPIELIGHAIKKLNCESNRASTPVQLMGPEGHLIRVHPGNFFEALLQEVSVYIHIGGYIAE